MASSANDAIFFTHSSLCFWLAPLVALPALIHLLNRKFPRLFRFSSIEQIKKSIAQRSKLFRWRHLILALVRTAALLLLLLAFLKPVQRRFGSRPDETGPRHVLVMFDRSLSMERLAGSLTEHQRGVLELEKIINTLGADDLINVRAIGRDAQECFPDFSSDHSEALRFARALAPGLGRADFNKANAAIAQELKNAHGRQEVYYISDFQRATWADVDLALVPESVRDPGTAPKSVPLTVYSDDKEIARTSLTPGETGDATHLTADFLPEKAGRYRAVAGLPGGQKQEVK